MPFGPINAPTVYITLMLRLRSMWTRRARAHPRLQSAFYGSSQIVDDTLLWSNSISDLLLYLDIILSVCLDFRISLKLKKCTFLDPRLEFVGVDMSADGQMPAASKYSLIQQWPLPTCQSSLTSFIGLCGFYRRFCPWFEVNLSPFRSLIKKYNGSSIPLMAWSPALRALFDQLKRDLTSDPCLARACSSKPFFLKTDWSSAGMGWILMQPDDSAASQAALAALREGDGDSCEFDLNMNGPRLRPTAFGSRKTTAPESTYHSMTGEACSGRYGISCNRRALWGGHFYWITDCISLKALFDYDGPSSLLRRWSQELLSYNFTIIHRPSRMMKDVDAISRWCFADPLLLRYETIAANLRLRVSPTPAPRLLLAKSLCTIPLLRHVPCFTSPQLPRLCSTPVPCFVNSPLPSPIAWLREYSDDPCTGLLLAKIRDAPPPIPWSIAELAALPAIYREPARSQRIFWANHRLCLARAPSHSKPSPLIVIIVPRGLRLHIFRALHAAPSAGHMGFYKTFYRIRVRFIFPGMRKFISHSIKSCAHCILANSTVRDASELMYSTPPAEPFSVIHADLWSPGSVLSPSANSYILVCMDELTGFVYVVMWSLFLIPCPAPSPSTSWNFSSVSASVPL